MSAQIAAYGRLGGDPVERTSAAGKTWATASLACQIGDDDAPLWLGIVAFGKTAEMLCRHNKGDLISVSGQLRVNRWSGRDGQAHERLQIVVDALVSARTTRPAGRKSKTTSPATSPTTSTDGGTPFDDPLPSDWGRP